MKRHAQVPLSMNFAMAIPGWNSLDAVRRIHSDFELAALALFALLVLFDILAHFAKKDTRKTVLEKIGLLWFALAVACELIAYPYGQRNDTLSERVIGSLDAQVKEAEGNATKAVKDSRTALSQASDALSRSGEAEKSVGRAENKATQAENDLAASLQRTTRLEVQLSWRTVTPEQAKAIKDFLFPVVFDLSSPFRGKKIGFTYLTGDLEAGEYAEELAKAVRNAIDGSGAEVGEQTSMSIYGLGPPPTGLVLETRNGSDPAAILLQRALKNAGIDAPGELAGPEKTITLFVAVKPKQSQ